MAMTTKLEYAKYWTKNSSPGSVWKSTPKKMNLDELKTTNLRRNMHSFSDVSTDSFLTRSTVNDLEYLKAKREVELLQQHIKSCPLDVTLGNEEYVKLIEARLKDLAVNNYKNNDGNKYQVPKSVSCEITPKIPEEVEEKENYSEIKKIKEEKKLLSNENATLKRKDDWSWLSFFGNQFVSFILALVFGSFVISYCLVDIHDSYISPMIQSAKWDVQRLSNEFTYYERQCDASDLTAKSLHELMQNDRNETKANRMMRHGMTIFPSLMKDETMDNLRSFILKRNGELTDQEEIPLDGSHNRWSFGIGASEDPIVEQALYEISTNSELTTTLQTLLGDVNPAVVEITAITAAHGATFQGFHADVKPLASSVKYSRSFTHSYSLFVPLQDTTSRMGATELCPGTHYCSNDLTHVCETHGFQAASEEQIWKKGNALLLNQCAWHRGYAHTDPDGPERVVFILTFISRPRPGLDYRQLSHGTYFHIRWDMYGHTLFDLRNAAVVMSAPFSVLRSSGLWKPQNRQWGWDWLTTACLRIANNQNGYQFDDLYNFVYRYDAMGLPFFLQGDVSEDGGWETFIQQTLHLLKTFTKVSTIIFTLIYIMSTLIIAIQQHKNFLRTLLRAILRLALWYSFVLILAHYHMDLLSSSQWAKSIKSNTLFAKPFRPINNGHSKNALRQTSQLPGRDDVLIGSRYDSRYIGIYNHFLDFHPGNYKWHDILNKYASLYQSYGGIISPVLKNHILETVTSEVGSFLKQDEFNVWRQLSPTEVEKYTNIIVRKKLNTLLSNLDQEISFLEADTRYQVQRRNTGPLQKISLRICSEWRKIFFDLLSPDESTENFALKSFHSPSKLTQIRPIIYQAPSMDVHESASSQSFQIHSFLKRNSKFSKQVTFVEGQPVEINIASEERWYLAKIQRALGSNLYEIRFDVDGEVEIFDATTGLMRNPLYEQFQTGETVEVLSDTNPDIFDTAKIIRVHPFNAVDVIYHDSIEEKNIPTLRICRIN